jgi:hypothetical protein
LGNFMLTPSLSSFLGKKKKKKSKQMCKVLGLNPSTTIKQTNKQINE